MAQPQASDPSSRVHWPAPHDMTSLAVKSITHLSGDLCATGVTSHEMTVSAGSSLMESHCLRRPSPNHAPHHAPPICWNRIPVAASRIHTEALPRSGVAWDLRFVASGPSPSGGFVWMYWPLRGPVETIWRRILRPWGTKLMGLALGAELDVCEDEEDNSAVLDDGSTVVVVVETDSAAVLEVCSTIEDGSEKVRDVPGEVNTGVLVGSSSDVEEGCDVAAEEMFKNAEKDVRTMVEKDPVLLDPVAFENPVKLGEKGAEGSELGQSQAGLDVSPRQRVEPSRNIDVANVSFTCTVTITGPAIGIQEYAAELVRGKPGTGSGSEVGNACDVGVISVISVISGESCETTLPPGVKGTMTVSVTVGSAAVDMVGPASIHEQALSKRYDTSP
jgi:hypothetical protein